VFFMFPIFHMPTILASQTMGIFDFETFKSLRLTNIVFLSFLSAFLSLNWSGLLVPN
jgi:hypothetical protein